MRNQPPQSYYNDEMTVLLDSDTLIRAATHSLCCLLHPISNSSCHAFSAFLKFLLSRAGVACLARNCPLRPPRFAALLHHAFSNSLSRDDDLFFPQNIDPDYHESSRLLASTVLIEPDRQTCSLIHCCSAVHVSCGCAGVRTLR